MIEGLKRITFAGNFGDLSTNPEMVAITHYLRTLNKNIVFGGDTNGTGQNEAWWQGLGANFSNGMMAFALDGLADTHVRHRVDTNFNTVIQNIRAFVRGGGQAYWKFILFAHNEHQIEKAKSLARKIGCTGFAVISSRDYNDDLRKPKHFHFDMKRTLFRKYQETSAPALCNPIHKGSIYLAADGTVHPCCFAHCMYICEHNKNFDFIVPLVEKYLNEINFKTQPLEDILAGPYFKSVLEQSRSNRYCRMKCSPHKSKIRKQLVLYETIF